MNDTKECCGRTASDDGLVVVTVQIETAVFRIGTPCGLVDAFNVSEEPNEMIIVLTGPPCPHRKPLTRDALQQTRSCYILSCCAVRPVSSSSSSGTEPHRPASLYTAVLSLSLSPLATHKSTKCITTQSLTDILCVSRLSHLTCAQLIVSSRYSVSPIILPLPPL